MPCKDGNKGTFFCFQNTKNGAILAGRSVEFWTRKGSGRSMIPWWAGLLLFIAGGVTMAFILALLSVGGDDG